MVIETSLTMAKAIMKKLDFTPRLCTLVKPHVWLDEK
jgi:hypothetical protein